MPGFRFQQFGHFLQHVLERFDADFPFMVIENLNETRHMRALEIVRQVHVHIEMRDGVLLAAGTILDAHGMTDILDAHFVDGNAARVGAVLHVGMGSAQLFGRGLAADTAWRRR